MDINLVEELENEIKLKGNKKIIVLSGVNNIDFLKKIILENGLSNCAVVQSFGKDECKIIEFDDEVNKLSFGDHLESAKENNIKKFINKKRGNKWS